MIQEDYVTFEQAKKLKEKGFPQDIDDDFPDRTMILLSDEPNNIIDYNSALIQGFLDDDYLSEHRIKWYVAPTFSLVQKWFINEWNIHIFPECETDVDSYGSVIGFHYNCTVLDINLDEQICSTYILENYKTPEQALSKGINKALELI